MRKFTLLLFLSFLLAACAGTAPPTDSPGMAQTLPSQTEGVGSSNCTAVSREEEHLTLPVTGEDWVRGPDDAPVTIIEYSDFQCPFCAKLTPILDRLLEEYPDDVRLVFRHFPLIGTPEEPFHDKAALAAQAAEAAGLQGHFWEMHDLLFERQADWTELSVEEFESWLIAEAENLDLDVEQFAQDLVSDEMEAIARQAWEDGVQAGLSGTPFVIVNGRPYSAPAFDYQSMSSVVAVALLEERQFSDCPSMTIDPLKEYVATLHTEKGDIIIRLFPQEAPFAVNNFVFLAENDWYDNVTFHRVIEGFVAQGGDPSGTGFGHPGYYFNVEISPDYVFDRPGLVAMANAGPTTNGSQFFITYDALPNLNGRFTIFGEVIQGMDVVLSLTPRDPQRDPNAPPGDLILDVSIEER